MVCLYCGKKLTMVKKLTAEDFCSLAHRRAYHEEQEKLVVARLQEEQARMTAGAKPKKANLAEIANAGVKSKGKKNAAPGNSPEFADYLSHQIVSRPGARGLWPQGLDLAISLKPVEPAAGTEVRGRHTMLADAAGPDDFVEAREIGGENGAKASVESAMRALSIAQEALPPVIGPQTPLSVFSSQEPEVEPQLAIQMTLDATPPGEANPSGYSPQTMSGAASLPVSALTPLAAIDTEMVNFEAMDLAPATGLRDLARTALPALPKPLASCGAKRFTFSRLPDAATVWHNGDLSLGTAGLSELAFYAQTASIGMTYSNPEAESGGLKKCFPQNRVKAAETAVAENREAVAIPVGARAFAAELRHKETPAMLPELSMAILAYPVTQTDAGIADEKLVKHTRFAPAKTRAIAVPKSRIPRRPKLLPATEVNGAESANLYVKPAASSLRFGSVLSGIASNFLSLPENWVRSVAPPIPGAERIAPFVPKARVAVVRRSGSAPASRFAQQTKLFEISFEISASAAPEPKPRDPLVMRSTKAIRPLSDLKIQGAQYSTSPFSALSQLAGGKLDLSWTGVKKHWHSAPNDLRWIACAVPIIIGLIWFTTTPGVKDDAKGRLSSMTPNTSGFLANLLPKDDFQGLKVNIQRRAAVELSDDFRQGLGEWSGSPDWAQGWRYDSAGFIRPRQMALYSPSLALGDYRFEFLGQIEKKALSWVFRAADLNNYYVNRLEMIEGGPLPRVDLVRYAVIDGKAGPKKSIRLPMQVYQDTIYRVRMDVQGPDFVTTVLGQVVDVFSDDRLPRGGVGFYAGAGEDVRLRWVEVSHQYDFLGRLCAFLVPYNVSNSNERSAP